MMNDIVKFIQSIFGTTDFIPLHEPHFIGNEKKYLNECIDSTFVSSVGTFVDRFEQDIAAYTGAKYAIATINGTSALHISLLLAGVESNHEVITQSLTFVATCNAISYCGACPIFVDVDKHTMGLSPSSLRNFLEENTQMKDGQCVNKITQKIIKACVPMHTFGHPCRIDKIKAVCDEYAIVLVEDAAESLGSFYKGKHTGMFGELGVLSFNGNKIITSGGGGCILTNNEMLAKKAKHLTTTAKILHKWAFNHDMIGYNYRMPNLNAALLVAQLEKLPIYIKEKRKLALCYQAFFKTQRMTCVEEPEYAQSNYWLNVVILSDMAERDYFLEKMNASGIMTRPIWTLMNKLEMFKPAQCGSLNNAEWLAARVVNIPSSVIVS